MEQRVPGAGGKILELTALHAEHPAAIEATLIAAGLRWRHVYSESPRKRANAWRDIAAVIETAPWDSPIARALEPKDWPWGNPLHNIVVSILEATQAVNVKTIAPKNVRRSDFLQVPRPWDQSKASKTIGTPMPLADLDAWLAGDFTPTTTETHGGRKEITAR